MIRMSTVKRYKGLVLDIIRDDAEWEGWTVLISAKSLELADTLGETDLEKKIMVLDSRRSLQETFKTFIHEILHILINDHNRDREHERIYKLGDAITADLSPLEKTVILGRIGRTAVVDE